MLLVLDIGNTNITFGLFKGVKLFRTWRCVTKKVDKSAGQQVSRSLKKHVKKQVKGIAVSSVVPEIDLAIKKVLKKRFGINPLFVNYKNACVKIGYPIPKEIGADRLVNARAAWEKYKSACIVVDFGTATTLDYIDENGVYFGGSIAPGINLVNDALYKATSKLPRIKIAAVKKMIPTTTVQAMQSGVYQGYIGLVERLIRKTIEEVRRHPKIIVTGGLAPLIIKGMETPTRLASRDASACVAGWPAHLEPFLTLEGLKAWYVGMLKTCTTIPAGIADDD